MGPKIGGRLGVLTSLKWNLCPSVSRDRQVICVGRWLKNNATVPLRVHVLLLETPRRRYVALHFTNNYSQRLITGHRAENIRLRINRAKNQRVGDRQCLVSGREYSYLFDVLTHR